jgi:hypothetical protein
MLMEAQRRKHIGLQRRRPMSRNDPTKISDVKVMLVKGVNGSSIESIEKTGTLLNVDTYTITLTDGSKETFEVTNGVSITGIAKTGVSANVDTYTIYLSDGSTFSFTVTNGTDTNAQIAERVTSPAQRDYAKGEYVIFNDVLCKVVSPIATGMPFDTSINLSETTVGTELTAINDDISEISGDITDIEGDITDINGDITTIEGNVSTLNTNVGSLQTKLAGSRAWWNDSVNIAISGTISGNDGYVRIAKSDHPSEFNKIYNAKSIDNVVFYDSSVGNRGIVYNLGVDGINTTPDGITLSCRMLEPLTSFAYTRIVVNFTKYVNEVS